MTEPQKGLLTIAAMMSAVVITGFITGTIIASPASLVRRNEKPLQFFAAVLTYGAGIMACVLWAIFGTF